MCETISTIILKTLVKELDPEMIEYEELMNPFNC